MSKRLLALALALAALVLAGGALAYAPPRLDAHVVDAANVLAESDRRALDDKLTRLRQTRGFAIVVLTVPSLEGESIEDVAYDAFNAWGVGDAKRDDGVLLVIAPAERRTRIETGKGVGGALPDLLANDILRSRVNPLLAENRYREAIDQGTDAIAAALAGESTAPPVTPPSPVVIGVGALAILLVIILAAVSPGFRAFLWIALRAASRGGSGGGAGAGYSGGGGRSGGGGSSASY